MDIELPLVTRTAVSGQVGPRLRAHPRSGLVAVRRGVVAPAGIDCDDPDVRIAAIAAQLPPHGVISGWAGARLHEASHARDDLEVFDGDAAWDERGGARARVLVCTPRQSRLVHRPDVRVFRSPVPEEHRTQVGGVPVASSARCALDMARLLPLRRAVIAVDRLLNIGALDVDSLAGLVLAPGSWHGRAAARRVLDSCDGGAESPQESLLRLVWTDVVGTSPLANRLVVDARGRVIARVDLLDPDAGVVGEYDGAYHASSRRRSADAARQELLEATGLVVVRATSVDVRPDGVLAWSDRLRTAYRRAVGRPRTWGMR